MPRSLPLTLRPSRLKWIALLLVSIAFVAGCLFLRGDPGWNGIEDWVTLVFFALCGLVALVSLMPGASYLRLDARGFETRTLYRSHRTEWADVAEVGIICMPPARKQMVGWNYRPGRGKPSRLRKFNLDNFGFEAALPDTYGMKASDLVALLELLRARAGEA